MNATQKKLSNPLPISDEDIVEGMQSIPGYIDITVNDFKILYQAIFTLASKRMMQTVSAAAIMQSPVLCVPESASLGDAIVFLGKHEISGAPVVNNFGQISGVVSEKDIFRSVGLDGMTRSIQLMSHKDFSTANITRHTKKILVSHVMTQQTITLFEKSTLADILAVFKMHSINRIPVVDTEKKPVGIITRNDLIDAFSIIHP